MGNILIRPISSLEKVFLTDDLQSKPALHGFSALCGETFGFQLAVCTQGIYRVQAQISVESALAEHITLYAVENVPCELPCSLTNSDDDYITKAPGLFPDVLTPIEDGTLLCTEYTRSVWVDVAVPPACPAGEYPITVTVSGEGCEAAAVFTLQVIPAVLPPQQTVYTQWFHTDCLSDYFGVPVFSEQYWRIVQNYVRTAVQSGVNMILTPLFTPPLDTAVGGERKTVQLVDIVSENGTYRFGFDKLERWVRLCRAEGIRYFEMPHLFTQWGARCTPKIMAEVDGETVRLFGWDVPSDSEKYRIFLDAFLPALTQELKRLGISEQVYFHISDEPTAECLDSYVRAKAQLGHRLDGFTVMDALSDVSFYDQGIVTHPVCSVMHAQTFYDRGVPDLWIYTCCEPMHTYSNRFLAMPSGRNRILGTQMYLYDVKGFLHWGMNFYNTHLSRAAIDPYRVTDAGAAFSGGDAFSLYPYRDGATPSIRSRVFYDGLQDMRALQLLEMYIGREAVEELVHTFEIKTFADYSHEYSLLMALRKAVNDTIAAVYNG